MIRLFSFLLTGCWHQWVTIKEVRVHKEGDPNTIVGTRYDLQCKHCGNIKMVGTK